MSSRAIHLEVTSDLSTDTFIKALCRFLARRGPDSQISCDNGKNFEGARNELRNCIKEMNKQSINDFLLSESCNHIQWVNNVPKASHMGGVWERMIRTVRKILCTLLHEHVGRLNDECF